MYARLFKPIMQAGPYILSTLLSFESFRYLTHLLLLEPLYLNINIPLSFRHIHLHHKMGGYLEGFPIGQMVVISLIRFSEPITFTSLFPYVYFMIRDFGIAKDPSDISKYTGILAASFAFSQFLFCIHWGRLSDRIGRKPVLLTGLCGLAVTILAFGFSKNFYTALAARTLAGALNGNVAVLQTVVGELVTERRHQSLAFATLPLLWNVGCVIGPLIGGSKYLTRPKADIEEGAGTVLLSLALWHDQFLNKYPYALSNVVVAFSLLTSAVSGFLFLEETQAQNRTKFDIGLAIGDSIRRKFGFHPPVRPWEKHSHVTEAVVSAISTSEIALDDACSIQSESTETDEITPLLPGSLRMEADMEAHSIKSAGYLTERSSEAVVRRYSEAYSLQPVNLRMSTLTTTEKVSGLFEAFADRNIFTYRVIGTMMCYCAIAFHALVYSEFVPVFLAAKFKMSEVHFPWHIKGGMEWTTGDIGTMLSIIGLVGCCLVLFVFPYLDRHVRTITGFRIACCLFPIAYFLLPYNIFLTKEYNSHFPASLHTITIYMVSMLATFANSLAFPQVTILVFRATKPEYRALVNATTMSANSLARFIAPLAWGALSSYFDARSLAQIPWNILFVISILGLILAFKIDEYNEDIQEEVD